MIANTKKWLSESHKSITEPKTSFLSRYIFSFICLLGFFVLRYFFKNNYAYYFSASWILPYLSLLTLVSMIRSYRYGRYIHKTIAIPIVLILAIFPMLSALGSIIVVCLLVVLLFLIIFGILPTTLLHVSISLPAAFYMTLTFTSIVVTTFGDRLIRFWHRVQESDIDARSLYTTIALSIINEKKAKFLVFSLYFIILIIFNFCTFNNIILFDIQKTDIAILKYFATYLAFDRCMSNKNMLKG